MAEVVFGPGAAFCRLLASVMRDLAHEVNFEIDAAGGVRLVGVDYHQVCCSIASIPASACLSIHATGGREEGSVVRFTCRSSRLRKLTKCARSTGRMKEVVCLVYSTTADLQFKLGEPAELRAASPDPQEDSDGVEGTQDDDGDDGEDDSDAACGAGGWLVQVRVLRHGAHLNPLTAQLEQIARAFAEAGSGSPSAADEQPFARVSLPSAELHRIGTSLALTADEFVELRACELAFQVRSRGPSLGCAALTVVAHEDSVSPQDSVSIRMPPRSLASSDPVVGQSVYLRYFVVAARACAVAERVDVLIAYDDSLSPLGRVLGLLYRSQGSAQAPYVLYVLAARPTDGAQPCRLPG